MGAIKAKADQMVIAAQLKMLEKKDAVDQIIIMFIIIAVAAGIAGLLYIFEQRIRLKR